MKDWLKNKFSKVTRGAICFIGNILGLGGSVIGLALVPAALLAAVGLLLFAIGLVVVVIPILAVAILGGLMYSGVKQLYEYFVDRKDLKHAAQECKNSVERKIDYAIERAEGINLVLDQDGKSVVVEKMVPISEDELLEYHEIIKEKNKVNAMQYAVDIAALNALKEQLRVVKKEEAEGLKRLITSLEFKIQDTITKFSDYTITDPESAHNSISKLYESKEKVRKLKI